MICATVAVIGHLHGHISEATHDWIPTAPEPKHRGTVQITACYQPPFPQPINIHVGVPVISAPIGVASDGASTNLAPVTTTSTAARTRKRGRSRAELANERTT